LCVRAVASGLFAIIGILTAIIGTLTAIIGLPLVCLHAVHSHIVYLHVPIVSALITPVGTELETGHICASMVTPSSRCRYMCSGIF
jgi:hypothetical protein